MTFSYVFTLFMFFGGLFGAGNDLLDYVPADAYWKLKSTPMKFEKMADEVRLADPEAAVNLAKVFSTSKGPDRDRLALALIEQGESARTPLDRLTHSDDADLAARAKECLAAIDNAPKERSVRRLMAIRTLGAMGKKEAIPLLQPLLASKEPFVAAYSAEAIATLEFNPAPIRTPAAGLKDDIWRIPAGCRAVAQIAPKVAAPELADRVLAVMRLPDGIDRADAIDSLTYTLVQIADRFGDMRFDGITLAASGDLGENSGYVLAILRGYYDHATVNRVMADARTPYNEFPGGRIYVPGSMAIYAPADDLLIFAASPRGTPPVQAVITAAESGPATRPSVTAPSAALSAAGPDVNPRLNASPEMVKLLESVDTTQPVWLAARSGNAWHDLPMAAALETVTLTGRPARTAPLELHLGAKLTDAAAARDFANALTALLPRQAQAGTAGSSSTLLATVGAALTGTTVESKADRVYVTAMLTLTRADVMRLLLTSMGPPSKSK